MSQSETLNTYIDEAITYLRVVKKWNNDELQDGQNKANMKNWFYKLLVKI